MSEPPPKKKRKPGGFFCAMRGCSNRSSREFDSGLKRHLCYRNFLVFVNKGVPLGKGNRVVLPRCVVNKIRGRHPDHSEHYVGYKDPVENL